MNPISLKLYFYSNRNIVGTGLAIVAAGLSAVGLIHDFWPVIVAGAYGVGALLTPSNTGMDISLAREMNEQEIIAGLSRIAADTQKTLPSTIAADVDTICNLLIQAIPLIGKFQSSSPIAYDVRTTATEYLPQTLDTYLQMPKAFRASVKDESGKTPTEMLGEQISLLKQKLTEMMTNVASADINKIAANGLFLKDKFATPELSEIIRR